MSSPKTNPIPATRSRNKMFDYRRAIPSASTAQSQQVPEESGEQSKAAHKTSAQAAAGRTPQDNPTQKIVKRKRTSSRKTHQSNIYDACASLIGTEGRLTTTHPTPISPEEILYQRQPIKRQFPNFQTFERAYLDAQSIHSSSLGLPDSDFLVALHDYTRIFYASALTEPNQSQNDFNSLDGSALLALGILMEETCRGYVEGSGSFPFLEGSGKRDLDVSGDEGGRDSAGIRPRQVTKPEYIYLDGVRVRDVITKKKKRRKRRDRDGSNSGPIEGETTDTSINRSRASSMARSVKTEGGDGSSD